MLLEGVIQPDARRGAAKQVVVLGEDVPDLAGVLDDCLSDSEIVKRDALTVEHPEDVVVRLHEQGGGVRKWSIVSKPSGIGMPVGANDGQVFYMCVQGSGDFEGAGLGWKQTIFMEQHGCYFTPRISGGAIRPALRSDHKYTHGSGGREFLREAKISGQIHAPQW